MKTAYETPSYTYQELTGILRNGIILTLFTIKFLSLNYILPFIGLLMINYTCFYLRKRNSSFKYAYIFSEIRLFIMAANFMLDWSSLASHKYVMQTQICISTLAACFFYFALDKGFESDYKDNNISGYKNRMIYFLILYLCSLNSTLLIDHIGIVGMLLSIFIGIASVFYIIVALSKIGQTLNKQNILICKDKLIKKKSCIFIILVLFYICSLVTVIHFTNNGFTNAVNTTKETIRTNNKIRNHLTSLGLDKQLVTDLSTLDLKYDASIHSINKWSKSYNYNNGNLDLHLYNCKISDKECRIICFYHWTSSPTARFYNILECELAPHKLKALTAKSFYEDIQDGNKISYTTKPLECRLNTSSHPYAKFDLPTVGSNIRGYLSFTIPAELVSDHINLNYYQQHSILNLPYTDITTYMNDYKHQQFNTVFERIQLKTAPLT